MADSHNRKLTALQEAKEFARQIVDNPDYRASFLRRAVTGQLPAAVEVRMLEYCYGKPVTQVETNTTGLNPEELENLSDDQLLARVTQIARDIRERRKSEVIAPQPGRVM